MLMKDVRELLPIGSIVLLKEAEKRLMVFGVRQTDEDTGTEYDYIGVLYPEGNLGENVRFLFNHEDIQEIYFRGFDDEERTQFMQRLYDYFESK